MRAAGCLDSRDGPKFCAGVARPRADLGDTASRPPDLAAMRWNQAPDLSFEYDSFAARITWSSIAFSRSMFAIAYSGDVIIAMNAARDGYQTTTTQSQRPSPRSPTAVPSTCPAHRMVPPTRLSRGMSALLYREYASQPLPSPSRDCSRNRTRLTMTTGPVSGRERTNSSLRSTGPCRVTLLSLRRALPRCRMRPEREPVSPARIDWTSVPHTAG